MLYLNLIKENWVHFQLTYFYSSYLQEIIINNNCFYLPYENLKSLKKMDILLEIDLMNGLKSILQQGLKVFFNKINIKKNIIN